MDKLELQRKVDELGPWHYCHVLPFGVVTGDCTVEQTHPKLVELLRAGAFTRPTYPQVLDLGANSGIISMWFVDNKNSLVAAVEGGPKYYPQLEFVIDVKGYAGKVIPIYKDITSCNFGQSNKYDLILFLGTLHHLKPDTHKKILNACLEALLPGGEIVVQTKSDLLVESMLDEIGFLGVRRLSTNWHDRAAWFAFKDPMKV